MMKGSRYVGRIPHLFKRIAQNVDSELASVRTMRRSAVILVIRTVFTSVIVNALLDVLEDDEVFVTKCRDFIKLFERVYRINVPARRGVVVTAMMVLDVAARDDKNNDIIKGRRVFIDALTSIVDDNVHAVVEGTLEGVESYLNQRKTSNLFMASAVNVTIVKTLEMIPFEESIFQDIGSALLLFLGMLLDGVGEPVGVLSEHSGSLRAEMYAVELFVCTENPDLSSGMRMSVVENIDTTYSYVLGGESVVNATHGSFAQFFNPRFYLDCFCVNTPAKMITGMIFVCVEEEDENKLVGGRCRVGGQDEPDYSFVDLCV